MTAFHRKQITKFFATIFVIAGFLFSQNEAQAALQYVGGAVASGASANYNVSLTTLTGGIGGAAIAGDLVIVATGFGSGTNLNPGVSTAGYTEVADTWGNDAIDANFSANWKIMGGPPDTSVTCLGSTSASYASVCVVHVWRGANQTTPMDVTATSLSGSNSSIPNSPAITPVTAGAIVISAGLGTDAAADTTVTAPTGYGNQVDTSFDPTNAATVGISSKAWSGSGAEDPAAWTNFTTSNADAWGAATLAIRPAPAPTASLSAASTTISYNTATTLNWSSTNATGCTATGGTFAGAKATSGSESTGNLTTSTTYTLYCSGPGGNSGIQSVTVTVGGAPTASLSAASTTISYNTATTLNWSSTNATGCTATGGTFAGAKATSGSESTGNLTTSTTYTLYCSGPGGNSGIQSVTVTVGGAPTGTVSAFPTTCTILSGGATCTVPFTWSIANATSPNLFNSTTATQYSTSTSGSGLPYPITNGSSTVQVRDASAVLASTAVTGSCTAGTTWNGSSCAVVVTYYTITATAGSNGTTTPSGVTNVAEGGSQTYSITPDPNYQVATLLIDSGSVTASTTYTFDTVTANHTISATFALIPVTHTITASAGSHGTIDPSGAVVVMDGASKAFTITPDTGFYTATLLRDGGQVSTSSPYTFTNVTADHTIAATFLQIPTPPGSYTIIANQNPNGTVTPTGSSVVTASSSIVYTITPNAGYDIASLIIDSFPLSSTSTTYSFIGVTNNHTIEATFVALPGAEAPVVSRRRLASITFSGKAFYGGKVSIIQKDLGTENVVSQQDVTNAGGMFQIRFVDVPDGAHSFGLLVKDPEGRTSQTKFFLIDARMGDEVYKDIVFPPTLDIMNGQVSRGGNVKVFGYASPGHTVRVYINDILVKEALAGNGGVYSFGLPTGALDFGQHKVRAKQINLDGGKESDFSTARTFIVSKLAVVKADWNGDGKIDIKDWSIFLARFTSRNKELRASVDLNGDGKTDISDFSIFIKTIKKK